MCYNELLYFTKQLIVHSDSTVSSDLKATMNCVHSTPVNPIVNNTKSQYLQLREFGLYLPPHLLMSYDMKQKYERPLYQLNITTR